jgi:transposase
MVTAMDSGSRWEEAIQTAGLPISRATAYRYLKSYRTGGGLQDGRQGHPAKFKPRVQTWLIEYCEAHPQVSSAQLQPLIQGEFGFSVSVRGLNEVRRTLGISRQLPSQAEAKKK